MLNVKGEGFMIHPEIEFIDDKTEISIDIERLQKYCKNKGLLSLILSEIVKIGKGEEYSDDKYKNKNSLKPEMISVFKNVTYIGMICEEYPLSLKSLLSLIDGTQINRVWIRGRQWLSKLKSSREFGDISKLYEEAHFKMDFDGRNDKTLTIEKL